MELKSNDPEAEKKDIITLKNISLRAKFNVVLKDINIILKTSEIHALLGGKGSGKSYIGNIICGNIIPDSGKISYFERTSNKSRGKTLKPRISMIQQFRTANPHFTVWEHMYHDNKEAYKGILVSKHKLKEKTIDVLKLYGHNLDIYSKIEELNEPDYLILELIRHSQMNPDVLIIDDTFSQLTYPYMEIFSRIIENHKKKGCAVLFITHNIELLYDFADRITIIRNGKDLFTGLINSIDKINLIRLTYTETIRRESSKSEEDDFYSFLRFNKAILENLPVNLIVLDVNNTIIMANEYFEKLLHLKREDYYNKHISKFFEWQNDRILKALSESMQTMKMRLLFNVPMVTQGRQTINTLKILPIHDGLTALGQIVVIEDVTDYFNFQKKLMLSDNMASIGLLAAGVAHEINNSLEIAFNYLRFLNQKIIDSELIDPMAELKEELVTIKQVVSKLVNFSESSLPKVQSTDLNALTESFVRLIEKHNEYNHIHFKFLLSENSILTKINPNEFRELLTNLIKNSREALKNGGTITIRTELSLTENGNIAILSVEDDGPGISPDVMETIFLPFYSTKKNESVNVGLGLSLCYSVVDRCGGTIYVENIFPKGCRFTIELPADLTS